MANNILKHSKYRNTGILFELLTRQITKDIIHGTTSPAMKIMEKYFSAKTELGKELQLYRTLISEKFSSEHDCYKLVDIVSKDRKRLDKSKLLKEKYEVVKLIRENYGDNKLFLDSIDNYKVYASIYKIFEYAESENPAEIVRSRKSITEHIMRSAVGKKVDPSIDELAKQPKDVRMLAYKIMVEEFNEKYSDMTKNQKVLLREYINNLENQKALTESIKKHSKFLLEKIAKESEKSGDEVTKIKSEEVLSIMSSINSKNVHGDKDVLVLMRAHELHTELMKLNKEARDARV